jgi:hypothetical protein
VDLVEELRGLGEKLSSEHVEYALCGGMAMAIYARPRATIDIDLMILEDDLEAAKRAAIAAGFNLDAGLMRFREGKSPIYRMTKILPGEPDPLMVDFLLVTPELRAIWDTRQAMQWQHGTLPVVSRDGLIRLKELRGSGQDQVDIERLRSNIDED